MLVTTPDEIFTTTDQGRIATAHRRRPQVRLDRALVARSPAAGWARFLAALDLPDLADRARTRLPDTYAGLADSAPSTSLAGGRRERRADNGF